MGVGGARAAVGRGRRGVPALNAGSRPPRRSRGVGKGIAGVRQLRGVAHGTSIEKFVYLPRCSRAPREERRTRHGEYEPGGREGGHER